MAINKVVLGEETLLDLTADTVAPDTLAKGVTAHDKTGAQITGTMDSGSVGRFGANYDFWVGTVDTSGKLTFIPTSDAVDVVFSGVKDLDTRVLQYQFYIKNNGRVKSVSFPDLEKVTGAYALYYFCSWNGGVKSISFPKLKHVSGSNAFQAAFSLSKGLTEVSFPSLLTVTGGDAFRSAFENISGLTALHFPALTQIGSDTHTSWANCGSQFHSVIGSSGKCTTLSFPELTAIYCTASSSSDGTFVGNDKLQRIDFPKLSVIDKSPAYTGTISVGAHKTIFSGCSALTEIHFGAANQAAIEATEGYPTLWGRGAGNATVYFDL